MTKDKQPEPAAALFDVDGTLVDTSYLHAVTWWEALRQAGHTVPMAEAHRAVGLGTEQLLEQLLGPDRDRSRDDELAAAHSALYAAYWPSLQPLPGAARLLRACAERGWQVLLATSAKEDELHALRAALDADDAIDDAVSADDVDTAKPAPDIVEQALDKAGARPERAVFVGDTPWDVKAAHRAGVRCIGVLSGGVSRAELLEAGADEVYQDAAELADRLADSLLGTPDR
ncbi:HAD family hydrolase [Streptacidiphilus sp. PB12-B1b]|uniref:HAD family hydrolase n=1 Tax=Streptacidiphilus sp. PB12-B1b TaxID=2705012 RepID=UPI0015F96470|nr:HAD family hydrolase [Streptacidiphilus sp. PB12-B1b]QMU76709.1 HAD family hydrolase [Streptacidiphilus sp. PB12-B1b]